ncbi:MAG: DUF1015 domain-containing protein [Planctomycetota bacterium]|jgi:uncharacterized protein (DUF1015 family)
MEIRPFKAFRFNKDVVGDVGSCIAPPYDVINSQQQQKLYEKNEYNIVRIIKGKTTESDSENDNQYTRAARYLNDWIAKGAVKQDSDEAIYGYVQDFELSDQSYRRFSFIALAKLEEFGDIVRPHEQILNKPIVDRLSLKKATSAKFGLVLMLYSDEEKIAESIIARHLDNETLVDFIDEQGVRHQVFAVRDKQDTDAISRMMNDKSCVIADGHHRYTTGLTYMKENPDKPAAKYQMVALSNAEQNGLIVLATHRVVGGLEDFDFAKLLEDLGKKFEITEFKFDSDQSKKDAKHKMLKAMAGHLESDTTAFGIYAGIEAFYKAVLKDTKAMDLAASQMSKPWRKLDVSVLHKLILEEILGIDAEKVAKQSNLEYVKDTETAIDDSIKNIDEGKKQLAFFMNPPKIRQINDVAQQGERMPQKSTYFYPKVYTGLTINRL